MAPKVPGQSCYCRHRYDDGIYHRMIDNAKQDEPLSHHKGDRDNYGCL